MPRRIVLLRRVIPAVLAPRTQEDFREGLDLMDYSSGALAGTIVLQVDMKLD